MFRAFDGAAQGSNFPRNPSSCRTVKSPKNVLILLLAATTVAGVVLAWRQYRELVELRTAAMNKTERSDLQRRVWDLEKQNRELRDQLARRGAGGEEVAREEGERPARDGASRGPGRGGRGDPRREGEQQFAAVREMMTRPEVQALINQQQKAAIDARYAPLFKSLNLPSDQVDKLKALLAERSTTMQDLMSVAREQGVNPRENPEAFRKLMTDSQNEINQSIRAVVGEQGFAQLSNFEQTMPQRGVVNELQQRLSYTNAPLTTAQAEQMVQILAANPAPRPAGAPAEPGMGPRPPPADTTVFIGRGGPPGGFDGGPMGGRGPDIGGVIAGVLSGGGIGMVVGPPDGGRGGGTATVTPAAVAQAQTVLTPPQVAALQQIQQQQQTQQQLRQVINETLSAAHPPGEGGSSATGPGGAPAPGARPGDAPKAAPRPGG